MNIEYNSKGVGFFIRDGVLKDWTTFYLRRHHSYKTYTKDEAAKFFFDKNTSKD